MLGKLLKQSHLQLARILPLFNQLHTVVTIYMLSNQLTLAPQLRSHYSWYKVVRTYVCAFHYDPCVGLFNNYVDRSVILLGHI